MADEASVAAVVDEVVAKHGGIDILVNNAGPHSAAYNKPSERDIVDALLFLVSPQASFVTGETLRVTGGFALSV